MTKTPGWYSTMPPKKPKITECGISAEVVTCQACRYGPGASTEYYHCHTAGRGVYPQGENCCRWFERGESVMGNGDEK